MMERCERAGHVYTQKEREELLVFFSFSHDLDIEKSET